MKYYEVVCALIENEEGKIFCCKRGPGRANEGLWEFLGGKIESNETREQALIKEIKEELKIEIRPLEYIGESHYTCLNMSPYNDFSITMYGYRYKLVNGDLELTEHTESKWCTKQEMQSMNFAPADRKFLK